MWHYVLRRAQLVWFRGSVSIVADAMNNNLSDASSNIVSVLGFKLASKAGRPRASLRPRSLRVLSGLVVAALVLLLALSW